MVIFCNNVTGYAPDLNTDFKNITVAVRKDLLSKEAQEAVRLQAQEEKEKQLKDEAQALIKEIEEFKESIIGKIQSYLPLTDDGKIQFDDKIDDIKTLIQTMPPGMKIYTMYMIIENKLLFSNDIDTNIRELNEVLQELMKLQKGLEVLQNETELITKKSIFEEFKGRVEQLEKTIERKYNRRKKSEKLIKNLHDKLVKEFEDVNLPNNIGNVAVFPAGTYLKRKKLKNELVKNGILVEIFRRLWTFTTDTGGWYAANKDSFTNTVWYGVINPTQFGGGKEYTGGAYGHISNIDMYKKITESLFFTQKSLFNHFYHQLKTKQQPPKDYNDIIGTVIADIRQKIEHEFSLYEQEKQLRTSQITITPDEEMEAFLFYLSLYDETGGVDDVIYNPTDIEIDETIVHNVCVAKRLHECIINDDKRGPGDEEEFSVIRDKIKKGLKNQFVMEVQAAEEELQVAEQQLTEVQKAAEKIVQQNEEVVPTYKDSVTKKKRKAEDHPQENVSKYSREEDNYTVDEAYAAVDEAQVQLEAVRTQAAQAEAQAEAAQEKLKLEKQYVGKLIASNSVVSEMKPLSKETMEAMNELDKAVHNIDEYDEEFISDIDNIIDTVTDLLGIRQAQPALALSALSAPPAPPAPALSALSAAPPLPSGPPRLPQALPSGPPRLPQAQSAPPAPQTRPPGPPGLPLPSTKALSAPPGQGGKRKTKKRRKVKKKRRTRKKKSRKKKIKKSKNTKKNKKKKPKKKIRRSMKRSKIMKNLVK